MHTGVNSLSFYHSYKLFAVQLRVYSKGEAHYQNILGCAVKLRHIICKVEGVQ